MNVLIVDDDPLIRVLLAEYAKRTDFIKKVETLADGTSAINYLNQHAVDLLLLDIEMPDISGMEVLQALSEPPITVLVTSQKEYALDAYEHGVIDYLVKPIAYHRFFVAVKKAHDLSLSKYAAARQAKVQSHAFIKVNNQLLKINLAEVLYIEALADYVIFHMSNGAQHIVLTTMKGVAEKLPENFIRVHRSYIVNYDHIESIEDSEVVIQRKHIAIGNTYKAGLLGQIKTL